MPFDGTYTIECWGAQGCNRSYYSDGSGSYGRGSYVSGDIQFDKGEKLYIFIGEQGKSTSNSGTWNGGGYHGAHASQGSGGGGTDVRLTKTSSTTTWNEFTSLKSRIIVAAGGGGSDDGSYWTNTIPHGGGINGINICYYASYNIINATQIDGGYAYSGSTYCNRGKFGCGNQAVGGSRAGGGGGYYGGGESDWGSMGGTCYISGHRGCIAVTSGATESYGTYGVSQIAYRTETDAELKSTHYSGKKFTNTVMIDGAGYPWTDVQGTSYERMPSSASVSAKYEAGIGHEGNGYCRITGTSIIP